MTSEWSDSARAVLAARIQQRMDELGIDTAIEMIRRTGMAPTTWYRIEQAKTVAPRTYRKVDAALDWRRGSCEAILTGGEPTPIEPVPLPVLALDRDQLRETARRLRRQADDLDRLSEILPD